MSPEVRCQCGHEWETRKPIDEIDQLRCSECGTASNDDLSVSNSSEEDQHQKGGILTTVEARAKQDELENTICDLFDRIDQAVPDDSPKIAPPGLESERRRLSELLEQLVETDGTLALAELNEIEDYLDDLTAAVDQHADELDRAGSLTDHIDELEAKRAELEHQVDQLSAETEELRSRKTELETKLGELEVAEDRYEQGLREGKEIYRVTLPCSHCGEEIEIMPGSEPYQSVVDTLMDVGWGHPWCQTPGQPSTSRDRA